METDVAESHANHFLVKQQGVYTALTGDCCHTRLIGDDGNADQRPTLLVSHLTGDIQRPDSD